MLWSAARYTHAVPWSPYQMPRSILLAYWDAELAGLITQSGGAVSSWKDAVGGYDMAQGTGSAQPLYGATSFNNRPGVSFDGINDCLLLSTGLTWLPSGSAGSEDWFLVDNQMLGSQATTGTFGAWGNGASTNSRRTNGIGVAGVFQARNLVGNGSVSQGSGSSVDGTGKHVIRAVTEPTQVWIEVDGIAEPPFAITAATTAGRIRMGADASSTATAFGKFVLNTRIITPLLTVAQANQLRSWLMARKA